MCLNVMRGCLAKIAEISSSWDELVNSFENLQVSRDLEKTATFIVQTRQTGWCVVAGLLLMNWSTLLKTFR